MGQRKQGAQLEVARIQSEINRLFETLIRLRDGGASAGSWTPGIDVAESAEALLIEAELPGVDRDSLEVSARGGKLTLRGRRDAGPLRQGPGAQVLHDEREFGSFEVEVPLHIAVNTHRAEARLARGLLRIQLPKVPNRRGESIRIPVSRDDE